MRVQIVDPPAYTPPYDGSLAAALARTGMDVELVTSAFSWGSVPSPVGYELTRSFYTRSARLSPDSRLRRPLKALEHVFDMGRYRARGVKGADIVHFQWSTFPAFDARMLPSRVPLAQTPHGLLRAEAWEERSAARSRLLRRMDALVALSQYGAGVLRDRAGVDPERIHVIPHGPLDYLTHLPDEAPLPPELAEVEGPVVLFFGLIRPYKGVDLLLEAFKELSGAELWVVGRPFGTDLGELMEAAGRCAATVRFVPRFVEDREVAAFFRRADVVALPHRDAEQSGVLFTALAFGNAIVMSDVGGFPEVAALGAGRTFPAGDAAALADTLNALLADPAECERLAAGARAAAAGPYAWDEIAARHAALYQSLIGP